MIRVNMLRSLSLAPGSPGAITGNDILSPDIQKQAIYRLLLVLAFPLALYIYQLANISALEDLIVKANAQVKEIENKKAKFGDAAPKVKKFTDEKNRIDGQLETIRGLMRNRLREVKALDALQNVVPTRLWLTRITIDSGKVKLEGKALDDGAIDTFKGSMMSSPVFSQYTPAGQSKDPLTNIDQFSAEFRIGRQEQE
jgi:Tfp pilus assembly protein PilN